MDNPTAARRRISLSNNEPSRSCLRCLALAAGAVLAGAPLLPAAGLPRSAPPAQSATPDSARNPANARRHAKAKPSPATPALQVAAAAPAAPVAPPAPNWPINDKPLPATVVWDSQGLRIDAANSSLEQILKDVSTDTGAKVEGLGKDQRIFGAYGPGPVSDVLSQLLDGSGYNVLMIGDQGEGTPRQIVLSPEPTGPAPVDASRNTSSGDDYETEQQADQDRAEPVESPPFRTGFGPPEPPGVPLRTPQQIMLQQQQQQIMMQQQQQQQQNMPQQPFQQPDNHER